MNGSGEWASRETALAKITTYVRCVSFPHDRIWAFSWP